MAYSVNRVQPRSVLTQMGCGQTSILLNRGLFIHKLKKRLLFTIPYCMAPVNFKSFKCPSNKLEQSVP